MRIRTDDTLSHVRSCVPGRVPASEGERCLRRILVCSRALPHAELAGNHPHGALAGGYKR
jgi:hypothetical protein